MNSSVEMGLCVCVLIQIKNKNAPATFQHLMELNIGYQMLFPTMDQNFPDLQDILDKLCIADVMLNLKAYILCFHQNSEHHSVGAM